MLKSGDTYTATREGKVFLTQYANVSAFVSVSRVLGDDPEAERAALDAHVDRLWHEAMLANHRNVNGAYEAMGSDQDIEKLIDYLERKSSGDPQTKTSKLPVRKHRPSSS